MSYVAKRALAYPGEVRERGEHGGGIVVMVNVAADPFRQLLNVAIVLAIPKTNILKITSR